jgi:hypothetical protein
MKLGLLFLIFGLSVLVAGQKDEDTIKQPPKTLTVLGVPEDEEQHYLVPLGSLFFFFVVIPGIVLWKREPDYMTAQERKSKYLVHLNYGWFRHIGWIGPVFSITACVVWSMLFHFDNVTKTHCPVANPLPSISAAVGNNIPERWFFRFGILFMSSQRFIDGVINYNWYRRYLPQTHWFWWFTAMMTLLHYLECFSLFAIAMISSMEYYPAHEKAFMAWAVLQQARMVITMYLFRNIANHPWPGFWQERSWKLKFIPWLINTLALVCSGVVFVLHNMYCWPYLYAMYGFFEYVVVASNVANQTSIACDWPEGIHMVWKAVGRRGENEDRPTPYMA